MMNLIHGPDPQSTIADFLKFSKEQLDLPSLPNIVLIAKHIKSDTGHSFASYSPKEKKIRIYAKNRHIMDVLRTLAHELVHYRQDLDQRLNGDSGKTGSPEENEAHAIAGQLMRYYGKMHPELFV